MTPEVHLQLRIICLNDLHGVSCVISVKLETKDIHLKNAKSGDDMKPGLTIFL